MGLISKSLEQCAKPKGSFGAFWLKVMNVSHTPYAKWHLSLVNWNENWTVLDEGCGGGKNIARLLKLCPKGEVYGIDYSEVSVNVSRKLNADKLGQRCFIEQGNAMSLDFEDKKFNAVTAFETVYFWPDLRQCFAETYRVLKSGGLFMFSYSNPNDRMSQHWEKNIEAMKLLPMDQVIAVLEQVGFKDVKVTHHDATYNIQATK